SEENDIREVRCRRLAHAVVGIAASVLGHDRLIGRLSDGDGANARVGRTVGQRRERFRIRQRLRGALALAGVLVALGDTCQRSARSAVTGRALRPDALESLFLLLVVDVPGVLEEAAWRRAESGPARDGHG